MIEQLATIFGLIQGALILFKRKENWIFYMGNIILLTIFSFEAHLYGDVAENLIYVAFGILGTLTWYSKTIAEKVLKNNTQIHYCSTKERIFYSVIMLIIAVGMIIWLVKTNDPSPYLDAITTSLGFTATFLMAIKRVESWILWLVDDVLMAYIYFTLPDQGFWLMCLNIIWVVFAIGTWISWHKEAMQKEK